MQKEISVPTFLGCMVSSVKYMTVSTPWIKREINPKCFGNHSKDWGAVHWTKLFYHFFSIVSISNSNWALKLTDSRFISQKSNWQATIYLRKMFNIFFELEVCQVLKEAYLRQGPEGSKQSHPQMKDIITWVNV